MVQLLQPWMARVAKAITTSLKGRPFEDQKDWTHQPSNVCHTPLPVISDAGKLTLERWDGIWRV
jgi:hypothetical protein